VTAIGTTGVGVGTGALSIADCRSDAVEAVEAEAMVEKVVEEVAVEAVSESWRFCIRRLLRDSRFLFPFVSTVSVVSVAASPAAAALSASVAFASAVPVAFSVATADCRSDAVEAVEAEAMVEEVVEEVVAVAKEVAVEAVSASWRLDAVHRHFPPQ
jgi:hypothetical protein